MIRLVIWRNHTTKHFLIYLLFICLLIHFIFFIYLFLIFIIIIVFFFFSLSILFQIWYLLLSKCEMSGKSGRSEREWTGEQHIL